MNNNRENQSEPKDQQHTHRNSNLLNTLLEPAVSYDMINRANNIHLNHSVQPFTSQNINMENNSPIHHSQHTRMHSHSVPVGTHTQLNSTVYMRNESEELSTNLDQTVLNLVNSNNIINLLGDAINQQQQYNHQSPEIQQQLGGEQLMTTSGLPNNMQSDQAQQQPIGFFNIVLKTLQSSLPFLIILVAKIFHQHLLGFFIVLGFMTTLHWSNRTLVNQVQLKVSWHIVNIY